MKTGGKSKGRRRSIGPQRESTYALELVAGSRELSELADLASEYASEIQRSPFYRPLGQSSVEPMPLVGLSSAFPGVDYGFGWYPSHLLRDEKLRQPPDSSLLLARGLLAGAVDPRQAPRIEQRHRAALAQQFRTERDAHPAFVRLCAIDSFQSVLDAFAAAQRKPKQAPSLREPQAEAKLIACMTRPLFRLLAKDWRSAPTKETRMKARGAAKTIIGAAKDGLHALPSYWQTETALRELIRELNVPSFRGRAPKLDEYTARGATLKAFNELLAAAFGADAFEADLRGVRKAFTALLGFQNASDKISP